MNSKHYPCGEQGGQFAPKHDSLEVTCREINSLAKEIKKKRKRNRKPKKVSTPILETVTIYRGHYSETHALMLRGANTKATIEVLKNPKYIYASRNDKNRYVFFGKSKLATFGDKLWIKVIVHKDTKTTGHTITVFPKEDIEGNIGELLYERKD